MKYPVFFGRLPLMLFLFPTFLGKSRLKSRQACAVESAARRSGLPVYIIMTSPVLTLKDNTTCQLYRSNLSIHFYTVDLETFTIGTPLGNVVIKLTKPGLSYLNRTLCLIYAG